MELNIYNIPTDMDQDAAGVEQAYMPYAYPVVSASHNILGSPFGGQLRNVLCASNKFIGCRCAASSKAEHGLECGHGLPPAIMAEDEFIEIKLELIAAHTVIGSD